MTSLEKTGMAALRACKALCEAAGVETDRFVAPTAFAGPVRLAMKAMEEAQAELKAIRATLPYMEHEASYGYTTQADIKEIDVIVGITR